MPAAWTYTSPAPLIPSIVLTGPQQRELWALPHFTDCPGLNLSDAILRGTAGSDPQHSSAGGLPLAKLFGRARTFTVTGRSHETADAASGAVVVSGTKPVTTTTHWTMTFTRLMHRPRGL
jgi:hypothetical protein